MIESILDVTEIDSDKRVKGMFIKKNLNEIIDKYSSSTSSSFI